MILIAEPPLGGLLAARAIQGLATGAFFGTCTAFLVDARPARSPPVHHDAGLDLDPARARGQARHPGGLIAEHAVEPLRLPFELHLIALAAAALVVATLPETVTVRSDRPLTLRLQCRPPSGPSSGRARAVGRSAFLSLFDGVALSLIPVFLVRTLGVDNTLWWARRGSWCWSRGVVNRPPRLRPDRAIGWGLAAASVVSLGVVASAGESVRARPGGGGGDRRGGRSWSSRAASTSAPRSPRSRTAAS